MKNLYIIVIVIFLFSCSDKEIEDAAKGTFPLGFKRTSLPENVSLINDVFEGKEIVIIGDPNDLFMVSFERELHGELIDFRAVSGELPVIMKDTGGSEWNVFGFAVSGPRKGQRLNPTHSLMGYWFSIATFYPGTEIYPENNKGPFLNEKIIGSDGWLIPEKEVRSGGVGKDGIPEISNPNFTNARKVDFLEDNDLVIGFSNGTQTKAYPHQVLDWHEIINDQIKDFTYSIIYCPLTGTATAWNRVINGNETSFGISGLLYNTNVIVYDRLTDSNWSQLFNSSVYGRLQGYTPENFMTIETKWETWLKMYPESEVVNLNTDYSRDYGRYPYGSEYKKDKHLILPIAYRDTRLHEKERVHAVIINGKARVYRFENFKF